MGKLRATIKKWAPRPVRSLLPWARRFLEGPGLEQLALDPYRFEPDPNPTPRLTMILPSLSARDAFGGVATGLELFADLGRSLSEEIGAELRVVSEERQRGGDTLLPQYQRPDGPQILHEDLESTGLRLSARDREIFLVFNWWTSLRVEPVLSAQAKHFGCSPRPKLYLIQEYEPAFHPFSAEHMLALHAFNPKWPTWGIFNSSELFEYYQNQNNRCSASYVFEPRIHPALRPYLEDLTVEEKERTVLVYCRPTVRRNCFSLLRFGLSRWAEVYGARHPEWRFLSAGLKHRDYALGRHHKLVSMGKLSLEEYGATLRRTAVGVSLMASPHPSYPPLEMAHFGARVLTNDYANKDMSKRHENFLTVPDLLPETLSEALERAVSGFEVSPNAGLAARHPGCGFESASAFDCLGDLNRDVVAALSD